MALDGGDRRHREREKRGDDWLEGGDHLAETGECGGGGGGGLGPAEVEAVGEELAVSGGDEDRAASGLGLGLGQSRQERVDEG